MMMKTKYSVLPKYDNITLYSKNIFTLLTNKKQLAEAFKLNKDERNMDIQNKIKPIHAQGISGIIQWKSIENHDYTGIFKSGGLGIIRLSIALPYSKGVSFTPGLAIKIFVDNSESINFHAMHSLDGQKDDTFFFTNAFSTSIESPKSFLLKILSNVFRSSIREISFFSDRRPKNEREIPLIEASYITSDGNIISDTNSPKYIKFVPKIIKSEEWNNDNDFRENIQNLIIPSTELYDIFDNNEKHIGIIELVEPFIASEHGDKMFFKHQQVSS